LLRIKLAAVVVIVFLSAHGHTIHLILLWLFCCSIMWPCQ